MKCNSKMVHLIRGVATQRISDSDGDILDLQRGQVTNVLLSIYVCGEEKTGLDPEQSPRYLRDVTSRQSV